MMADLIPGDSYCSPTATKHLKNTSCLLLQSRLLFLFC